MMLKMRGGGEGQREEGDRGGGEELHSGASLRTLRLSAGTMVSPKIQMFRKYHSSSL